ncbi:hypothetical protein JYK22_30330, partial [Nonomuraea sp. RK-328]|nr:hypothetical protein [Nonomuraea sp. RK-328]
LIEAVRRGVAGRGGGDGASRVFRTLAELQETAGEVMAELLVLPQVGCWAVESLRLLRRREPPDLAYLAAFTAGAAIRAGRRPELSSGTYVPGLGTYVGGGWRGLPWLRAEADGLALAVRLETGDPYLSGYGPRGASEPGPWRSPLRAAWRMLAERHRPAAEAIAAGFTTLVPLASRPGGKPASATSGWAYGAIALSPPPDAVTLAESLVHEIRHLVLGAVEDVVPLADAADPRRWYAPWRSDPRPLGALLQGCYASMAITAFWRTEYDRGPAELRERAEAEFAHRRAITAEALRRTAESGALTAAGETLVAGLRARLEPWLRERLSPSAERAAERRGAEHRARWLRANPGFTL